MAIINKKPKKEQKILYGNCKLVNALTVFESSKCEDIKGFMKLQKLLKQQSTITINTRSDDMWEQKKKKMMEKFVTKDDKVNERTFRNAF